MTASAIGQRRVPLAVEEEAVTSVSSSHAAMPSAAHAPSSSRLVTRSRPVTRAVASDFFSFLGPYIAVAPSPASHSQSSSAAEAAQVMVRQQAIACPSRCRLAPRVHTRT